MVTVSLSHRKMNGVGGGASLMRLYLRRKERPPQIYAIPVFFSLSDHSQDATTTDFSKATCTLELAFCGETYFPWEIQAQQFSTLTAGPPRLCFSTESGETVIETVHASIRF